MLDFLIKLLQIRSNFRGPHNHHIKGVDDNNFPLERSQFSVHNIDTKFYIRGSVHRNSRLKKAIEMQHFAYIYLLLNYCTCFGRPSSTSSGVHKTVVVAACCTDHTLWGASFLRRDQIRTDVGPSVVAPLVV